MTAETQGPITNSLFKITAQSGDKINAEDVENIAKIIGIITNSPDVKLPNRTLNNLISTIDNIQEKTELKPDQHEANEALRQSAVSISKQLSESSDTLKTGYTVGKF